MIRDACLLDFDAIFETENQVFQMHFNARPDMIKPGVPFNKDYYETCLNDEDMRTFVYEEDGDVLGYCITRKLRYSNHYLFNDMTILEINDMCVNERVRGKSIGRQLFNYAKEYSKEIGAAKIELSVWAFKKMHGNFMKVLGWKCELSVWKWLLNSISSSFVVGLNNKALSKYELNTEYYRQKVEDFNKECNNIVYGLLKL